MRKLIIPILSLLAVSCTLVETKAERVQPQEQELNITASYGDPETRTERAADGAVLWSPGDQISLFYGSGENGGSCFTGQNTEPSKVVNFTGKIGVITGGNDVSPEDTYFWAVYPFNSRSACDGSSITTVLPSSQAATPDTFADDLFPSIGRSRGLNMSFYNVCGGIKFSVTHDRISRVTLRGNNGEVLAGELTVSFGQDGLPVVMEISNPETEIVLSVDRGSFFEVGRSYYIVLPPTVFENGFTLQFDNETSIITRTLSSRVSIRRSVFGVLNNVDDENKAEVTPIPVLDLISGACRTLYSADSWGPECYRLYCTDRYSDDWNQRTQTYDWVAGIISPETGFVKSFWNGLYSGISAANCLIRIVNDSCSGLTDEQSDLYVCEAEFYRASFYMYLIALFGDVPYYDENGAYDIACKSGRRPKQEVLSFIYNDFDDAANKLPLVGENAQSATRGAALAMKARAALLMNDWQTCAAASKACIDLNVYSLHLDYRDFFLSKTKSSPELIFALLCNPDAGVYAYNNAATRSFYPRNNGGTAVCQPSWSLFFAYTCTDGLNVADSQLYDPANPFANRDPRLGEITVPFDEEFIDYIYNPRPSAKTTLQVSTGLQVKNNDSKLVAKDCSYNGLIIKKGIDEEWIDDRLTDTPMRIIRYGDVLLMYAESKMELGQIDADLFNAVNSIRARAYKCGITETDKYPAITETNQSALRKIIRNERRCELAWENRRWFDLIRWRVCGTLYPYRVYGLPASSSLQQNEQSGYWIFPKDFRPVMREDSTLDLSGIESFGSYFTVCSNSGQFSEHRYLLPIPQSAVSKYDAIEQNPGY